MPTWTSVLASWAPSVTVTLAVPLGAGGYLWLARRGAGPSGERTGGRPDERAGGRPDERAGAGSWPTGPADERAAGWPRRRTVSWLLAMAVLAVALVGPVGVYGEVLFWAHMVRHLLLITVVPILAIWARPFELVSGARSGETSTRWANPLIGLGAYTAVVVLTHLTGFQQTSATHGWVRAAELAAYLAVGWLYFAPLLGPVSRGLPFLLRFVLLALGMGADTLTGVALMLTSRPLAPVYAAAHPGWGPDALADQQVAGAIMWFGGDLLMMLLMILVAVQWGRAEPERQGLGSWLEGARRRALLGTADALPGRTDTVDLPDIDVDNDQQALDAYNATLAALHGREPARRTRR